MCLLGFIRIVCIYDNKLVLDVMIRFDESTSDSPFVLLFSIHLAYKCEENSSCCQTNKKKEQKTKTESNSVSVSSGWLVVSVSVIKYYKSFTQINA